MWALILAGGSSRRMGRSKQELPFDGGTLLERAVSVARQVAEEVVLVGDTAAARRLELRSAEDWQAGEGPLSALAGGLSRCPEGRHLLLGCDLPFLSAAVVHRLDELGGGADAVVPVVDGRRHPLSALYSTRCVQPALHCLERGERKMDALLDVVKSCEVQPEQMAPLDLALAVTNINTPEQYQAALRRREAEKDGP
jgi:molybdopterin-guanine dinucleotide biosynthesis protein A